MARYTVELCELMRNEEVMPKITEALSTYPVYTPDQSNNLIGLLIPTREQLNEKLLNHYKYHEIGFETVGRFLDELKITMCEIMPYYNHLYNTIETMCTLDNPFDNVDIDETITETKEFKGTTSGTNESNTTASDSSETSTNMSSYSKNVENDTPQGNVISKTAQEIDEINHADKIAWSKNNSNSSGESSGNSSSKTTGKGDTDTESEETRTFTLKKKGNYGVQTYAHDMIEFRESIIDVTNRIIEDIKIRELFMMVY